MVINKKDIYLLHQTLKTRSKMKTHYLKRNSTIGLQYFIKVVETKDKEVITLEVTNLKIEIDYVDNSFNTEVDWYKSDYNCIYCTKKEFDEFYIKTVKEINELSSL